MRGSPAMKETLVTGPRCASFVNTNFLFSKSHTAILPSGEPLTRVCGAPGSERNVRQEMADVPLNSHTIVSVFAFNKTSLPLWNPTATISSALGAGSMAVIPTPDPRQPYSWIMLHVLTFHN